MQCGVTGQHLHGLENMQPNVKAHIISYFGSRDYPDARKVRVDNHRKQVEFWKEYYPDMEIKILAQDYDDEDYIDGCSYITHDGELLTPGEARNILLKDFYNETGYEWALFMDNDAILKEHPEFPHTGMNICDILTKYPENFDGVDLFMPHWDGRPGDGAFKDKYNNIDPKYRYIDWDNQMCFDRKFASCKGTIFFVRRLDKNIYYNEEFKYIDGQLLAGEDDFFALEVAMNGYKTYMLRNIIMKEFTSPSTHAQSQDTRKVQMNKGDEIFRKAYNFPEGRAKWYANAGKQHGIYMDSRVVRPYNEKYEAPSLEDLFS